MELLKEQFITFVGLLLSGWAGWLFGRPKQRVELQASELDNVDKAIHIYREMIDDLGEKYAKAIADLKEANLRIKELETSIENLLKQLRKWQTTNNKSHFLCLPTTPYAIETERKTGISHLFILAQAALESAWGTHAPGNMFFG